MQENKGETKSHNIMDNVNIILLIMFLVVVIIIFFRNCGTNAKIDDVTNNKEHITVTSDSTNMPAKKSIK